jgi:hypothetical protein
VSDTKTIYVRLSIGYPGASRRDEIEVEADCTEEEIEQTVHEWASHYIDIGWSEEKPRRHW